jgi:hypothetical protein
MLATLPPIATEIHEKMPWIPREQPIYLAMDNTCEMEHEQQEKNIQDS